MNAEIDAVRRQVATLVAHEIFKSPELPVTLYEIQRSENRKVGYDPLNSQPVACNIFRTLQ